MVNGGFNPLSRARDFGFERGDPRPQLFDREPIEVLARQLGERLGADRWMLVHVHLGRKR